MGPWKKVIHIEDRVGRRGGLYWLLRLECGHLRSVRHKVPTGARALTAPLHFAPKRLRCLICGLDRAKYNARGGLV
jgi:hypothetical protein